MIVEQFRIHGIQVEVTSPGGPLTEAVSSLLSPFAGSFPGDPVFRFVFRSGEPPDSDDGLLMVERFVFANGREIRYYSGEDTRITHVAGRSWNRLDFKQRLGEVINRPGEEWGLEGDSLTPMLCDVLAREGHHVFHAATLVGQGRAGERAIILAGVSGVGKTTTSLALAHAGLPLLADDASFLVRRNGSLRVWGFPRPCKVHRKTLEMMDWLSELESNPQWHHDEFQLYLHRLSPVSPDCEITPGLLVLLQSRNDREHRFEPWDKLEAMTEMTRQNVRSMQGTALDTAGNSFAVVGDLVAGCRTLRLSIGPDLSSLADALLRELEN